MESLKIVATEADEEFVRQKGLLTVLGKSTRDALNIVANLLKRVVD